MNSFKRLLRFNYILLLSLPFLISCGDGEDPSSNEDPPCGTDITDGISTLTATFNGEAYCPTDIKGGSRELQAYIRQATTNPPIDSILYISINADATTEPKPGTFTVESGEVVAFLETKNNREGYYIAMNSESFESSGTVIIEEVTDSHMKGTFDLVLVATTGDGSRKPTGAPDLIISDGKFHVVVEE